MQGFINLFGMAFKNAPKIRHIAKVVIEIIDALDRVKDWDTSQLDKKAVQK